MKWILIAVLMLMAALPAWALESAPVSSKRAIATLVTDTDAIQPGKPFRVGLRLRMADGWHTYWKNPGDAGVPPDLTIEGGTQSPIDWPTPRRVAEGPVMTYAYTGEVLLPVTVTAATGAIKAHAQWLVCKDICVPEEGDFSLTLPLGTPGPSGEAKLFSAHDRTVPRPSPWTARISPDGTLFVQGPELSAATVTDAWFIPGQPDQIQDGAAQPLSVRVGGFTLALKTAKGFDPASNLSGVLSVRDRAGMQTDVAVSALPGPPPSPAMPPLSQILVLAFLGGLILNLMPCVFPILAMKAVALARHAGRGHGHAVSYTAGVLVTFVALAVMLLAARAAGTAAGWGFQFSSPMFVAGMTWLLFAVGLNLSGVFEVGGGLTGAGGGLADRHGVAGSFFTGLLAVLVATPCTAPFMGVAVAAGLAAPPVVTVLVFAVMGLGLSAPYVALASMPGLARLMPRPGRWMEILRQALAFPMYGGGCVAGLGDQPRGGPQRRAWGGGWVGAGGVCRLGVRRDADGDGPTTPVRAGHGGDCDSGVARGAVRDHSSAGWRRDRGLGGGFHAGTTGDAACGREAGLRQHDGGVVRDLPAERAGGDLHGGGAKGFRKG